MRAVEVLDSQRDLIERLQGQPSFRRMVAHLSAWTFEGPTQDKAEVERRADEAEPFADLLAAQTRTAYAYRVTPDMSLLVQHAADGLDDSDEFDRNLAPTGAGFVRFDRPLPMSDVRGKQMLIHWLVWGPGPFMNGSNQDRPGTALWFFNDPETEPDEIQAEYLAERTPADRERVRRVTGRWATVALDVVHQGTQMGPAVLTRGTDGGRHNWSHYVYSDGEGESTERATNLTRYVHALWLMLNQTITVVEPEHLDRAAVRRARRMNIPAQVSVIRLRRTESNARLEGESLIQWYHRWVVRRHPAWRKCGPNHPGAQPYEKGWRVRLWIEAYEKGPEGAPLVVTDKLYSLDR